jgi:hypothetical protein
VVRLFPVGDWFFKERSPELPPTEVAFIVSHLDESGWPIPKRQLFVVHWKSYKPHEAWVLEDETGLVVAQAQTAQKIEQIASEILLSSPKVAAKGR